MKILRGYILPPQVLLSFEIITKLVLKKCGAEICAIAYKCIDSIDLDRLSGAFFWHRPGSDSSVSITGILYIVESYPIY